MRNETLNSGELVRVYRNLTTGTLSVQTKTPKGWRVTAHVLSLSLAKPKFVSRDAGRNRVRRTKVKNVHAWVEGVVNERCFSQGRLPHVALYNPYKNDTWIDEIGLPLSSAFAANIFYTGVVSFI